MKAEAVLAGCRIDAHSADRIANAGRGRPALDLHGRDRCGFLRRIRGPFAAPSGRRIHGGFIIYSSLESYTQGGYIVVMRNEIKASCQKRLRRIEGQVRGLSRMVEEDRYCVDMVTQISAARAAFRRAEEEILRDHVAHCVEHAIASGNHEDRGKR